MPQVRITSDGVDAKVTVGRGFPLPATHALIELKPQEPVQAQVTLADVALQLRRVDAELYTTIAGVRYRLVDERRYTVTPCDSAKV